MRTEKVSGTNVCDFGMSEGACIGWSLRPSAAGEAVQWNLGGRCEDEAKKELVKNGSRHLYLFISQSEGE